MNIVVLIKQVPEIALIKVNEAQNKVDLPQGPGVVNPFDEYAVEEGIRIKEKSNGKCTVMTVGTERGESALRDCLALGADEAVLLTDPKFEGSDSQATGKILAAGLKKLGQFDIILSGKQAVDSDSSQVSSAVAAHLGLSQTMFVKKFEKMDKGNTVVFRMTEDGYDIIETPLPAVFSVVKEINEPRLPSLKGKMTAKKKEIIKWSAADLGLDGAGVGPNSGTRAIKVSLPPPRPKGEIITGNSPQEIADSLFTKLREKHII
jgi:electron transfer flavoprotein beta subunit